MRGLAGCGGTSISSPEDLTAFQQAVAAATQALASYQVGTHTMSSAAACSTAVSGYGTPMQGHLDRMRSMSGWMDDSIQSMGPHSRADVACGVQGMDDELRRHLGVACHEADLEHDREEAAGHIAAMGNGLQHMQMRVAEVSTGMGGMGSGMMDGGWRMSDGGTMDPDHHPMGCPGGMP